MKFTWLIIVLIAVTGRTEANSPASANRFEIVWKTDVKQWPETLWVYKVIPQQFEPVIISNLCFIAGFSHKDLVKTLPTWVREHDPKALYFGGEAGADKHLVICPTIGYIEFHDPLAEGDNFKRPIEGVPNEQETTALGMKYLRLLGIDRCRIATKPGKSELDLHWELRTKTRVDQKTQTQITVTNGYGILFNRCIDGVSVQGYGRGGGLVMCFGNSSKIIDLHLCWRNLSHFQLRPCISFSEVEDRIRNGQVSICILGTKATYPRQKIQKLTVTKANPRYEGRFEQEPMDFVYPYADFEGVIEDGQKTIGVYFDVTPLVK